MLTNQKGDGKLYPRLTVPRMYSIENVDALCEG